MLQTFDAIIIGSGQGGTPLAKKLARAGWKTALIERKAVGGTCINTGCTPTKTLIASAKTAYDAATAGEKGIVVKNYEVNMPAVIARKNKILEESRSGLEEGLQQTENLQLIYGDASFTGMKEIKVILEDGNEEKLYADFIFIDTGTRPLIPKIAGLEDVGYFTSTTLMEQTIVPAHLLIIGGNYIGLEFGQMYRRFGSRITILDHNKRFLVKEDEDIANEVLRFLEVEEIKMLSNAELQSVCRKANVIEATVKVAGKMQTISCSHILVSAGRSPNTEGLNLPATGVETDEKNFIRTNEFLETTAPGIYAIGDVKGGPQFTHISYNDHLILYKNIIEKKKVSIKDRMVPYCMFTDPQLGRIGITENEAKKQGLNVKVATLEMKHVARARETGHTAGLMKAVVDADSKQILGAAILGEEGGEVMSVLQMAMLGKVPYDVIKEMVIAHPTYAEALNNLFLSLDTK